ncbi:phenylalanine 4-monooxygenase [Xanthovirga aplysinae]|uniref:phenylalanine 4-monooxygenase n=1 Tax=Xanthovirga aplysinae TaxID=2529853 RepID=UPI0012BB50A8|nr:phenylalanine 4-monooxygenase [Xanthovirga aplysinae]MTI32362.1 phenylalanine 4-monooxygenase [Xanthovirga aplysinae]
MEELKRMKQEYDKYTADDFKVWNLLYERQMKNLPGAASNAYLHGVELFGFNPDAIPKFEDMNKVLKETTGWQLFVVAGLIPEEPFFRLLSNKQFPASTWFRKLKEIDYLEEPDMFHDTFGHIPLLTNKPFTDFLVEISRLGHRYVGNAYAIELVSRIYWFTVEFGLIKEEGNVKIYGAGILSSAGESKYCLSEEAKHLPYDVDVILNTPYRKDVFQDRYFVIDSYEQLFNSIPQIEASLDREVHKAAAEG